MSAVLHAQPQPAHVLQRLPGQDALLTPEARAFLADIRGNETRVMRRLFAGEPDPFGS